jgi:hypothetical protein
VVVVLAVAMCEAIFRLGEAVHAPYYALFLVGPIANGFEMWRDRLSLRTARPAIAGLLLVACAAAGCAPDASESVAPAGAGAPATQEVSAGEPGDIRFVPHAGLNFQHVSGASGRFYFVEQWGSGAAFLDFDSDGRQDLFLAQGGALPGFGGPRAAGNRLYRNRPDGVFEDVTPGSGLESSHYTLGIASADYDNDGDPDLFITTARGGVLYENIGAGRFADVTEAAGIAVRALATSAAFVDYDNDGRLDLFVARYQDYDLTTDRACDVASGGFPTPGPTMEYCGPGRPPVSSVLFRNEGEGRFRDVSRESGVARATSRGLGVIAADVNDDGLTDIFVASDRAPNLLFLNQGGGRLAESAVAAGVAVGKEGIAYAGMGVDAADYDNDGRIDVIITNYEHEPTSLYRNLGDGLFADESERSGLTPLVWKFMKWGVKLLDFDGDGRKDALMANGHIFPRAGEGTPLGLPMAQTRKGFAQEAQVLQQGADGRFVERSVDAGVFFTERRVFRGAAFADVDNDGDWDVVLTSIDGPATLLLNVTPSTPWAGVHLVGAQSNRDAIGATVTVIGGGPRQTFVVASGGSYLSDHDRRILIRATGAPSGVQVSIRWPCGARTEATLQPGQMQIVRESGCTEAIQR